MATDDNTEELNTENLEPASELGKEVIRQFRKALMSRSTIKAGDYNLDECLEECYKARDDQTSCEERELRDNYPEWAGMPVSIVSFKVGILVALIRESLAGVASAPFIVDSTPNPDIPKSVRDRVVAELANSLTEQVQNMQKLDPQAVLDEDAVMALIRQRKLQVMYEVKQHAKEQAMILQNDIHDKTIEGGYRDAIIEFADDFATYPFACIHGPFPVYQNETIWEGDKSTEEKRVVWRFERISPFDLMWTEDCTNTQVGTAVFIRKRVPYTFLHDALELADIEHEDKPDEKSGYVRKALREVIDLAKESKLPHRWVDFHKPNPESGSALSQWREGDTIDTLIRYGRFLGKDLEEMGFSNLDSDKAYETKVVMVGSQVIQCHINNNPSQYKRPVFTASFEKRNGSIVGKGLAQRLLPLHKAYRATVTLAMHNLGLSVEPITELDINRVLDYMPDDWIEDPYISPGQVIPSDGDRSGNSSRAVKFTQIPNITSQAIRMAEYIFNMSHIISNIPAALHGQPVGSGANRTVRGLLTLQGNTLKPIQSSLINLDLGVIEPMVQLLYRLLVLHDNEFDYTGDAKIVAKGAASMIEQEMDKQAAMENLQIVGQLGDTINPQIKDRTVANLLRLAKIIEPGEEVLAPVQAPQAPPVTPGGLPGAGLPSPNPDTSLPPLPEGTQLPP